MTKLTPQDRDEIVRRYREGRRQCEISRDFGVTGTTIRRVLRQAEVPVSLAERCRHLAVRNREITARYTDGEDIAQIGRDFGLHPKSVQRIATERGAPPRHPQNNIKLTSSGLTGMVRRYLSGGSVSDLAERYAVSKATIHRHLAKAGVSKRLPKRPVSRHITPETLWIENKRSASSPRR